MPFARKQKLNNIVVVVTNQSFILKTTYKRLPSRFQIFNTEVMFVATYFKINFYANKTKTKQKRRGFRCLCFDPRVKHGLKHGCIQNLS